MNSLRVFILFLLSLFFHPLFSPSQIHCWRDLTQYETPSGGFKSLSTDQTPSLHATESATFLARLYGQTIQSEEVKKFLQNTQNHDFGWGSSPGLASDLESINLAVASYGYLSEEVSSALSVGSFVRSLYDKNSGLFASRSDEPGNIVATLYALRTLQNLGQLNEYLPQYQQGIHKFLEDHAVISDSYYFSFPDFNEVSGNSYGVQVAVLTNMTLPAPKKLAKYIASSQIKSSDSPDFGGFAQSVTSLQAVNLATTVQVLNSLTILQTLDEDDNFLNLIDTNALREWIMKQDQSNLIDAADAHLILALSDTLQQNFQSIVSYDVVLGGGLEEDRIVQGSQVRPNLVVKIAGTQAIHSGLSVQLIVTTPSGTNKYEADFDANRGAYISAGTVDTSHLVGSLKVQFVGNVQLPGIGSFTFNFNDSKAIGFGIDVQSKAILDITGKELRTDEPVTMGTSFTFVASLYNKTAHHFVAGNFHIIFGVKDSSGVLINQEDKDCANIQELRFNYSVNSIIPPGPLIFSFKIRDTATNFIHTSTQLSYNLLVPIVASDVTFTNSAGDQTPITKIGDTVLISIVPGTFPDMKTVFSFPVKDYLGNDVSNSRKFFLDVTTSSSLAVTTVSGIPDQDPNGNLRYKFPVLIGNNFASIGEMFLSFRYSPTEGHTQFKLLNFDSKFSELFDETLSLNFTVQADLELADVKELPSEKDFYYGNEIEYEFSIKDTLSGSYVLPHPEIPSSSVYLVVSHVDSTGKKYTSAHVRSSSAGNVFKIVWEVNPNVVIGTSHLTLIAYDADNNPLPIHATDSFGERSVVSKPVTIGGNITVDAQTRSSTTLFLPASPFVVDFSLSCNDKPLKNAHLRALVVYEAEEQREFIGVFPVASTGVGKYSVSWTLPNKRALTGTYRVFFHRHSGDVSQPNVLPTEQDETNLSELFSLTINHQVDSISVLPIRTEFLVLILLAIAFLALACSGNFKSSK